MLEPEQPHLPKRSDGKAHLLFIVQDNLLEGNHFSRRLLHRAIHSSIRSSADPVRLFEIMHREALATGKVTVGGGARRGCTKLYRALHFVVISRKKNNNEIIIYLAPTHIGLGFLGSI